MTRGLHDPHEHYYRRLYADAVRAVEVARGLPEVDPDRVVVAGISQGGGVALAVSGLVDGLAGVMADVPFLCAFRRAVDLTDSDPYAEIVRWCAAHRDSVEQAFLTLDHVDAVHLVPRSTAPALLSVALRDDVCPPSTVFAAFNHYGGERAGEVDKEIRVWSANTHEGGGAHQQREQLAWLARVVGPGSAADGRGGGSTRRLGRRLTARCRAAGARRAGGPAGRGRRAAQPGLRRADRRGPPFPPGAMSPRLVPRRRPGGPAPVPARSGGGRMTTGPGEPAAPATARAAGHRARARRRAGGGGGGHRAAAAGRDRDPACRLGAGRRPVGRRAVGSDAVGGARARRPRPAPSPRWCRRSASRPRASDRTCLT